MRIALGSLAAAVALFVWGFVFWGILFQSAGVMLQATDEDAIQSAFTELLPESGVYFVPGRLDEDVDEFTRRHEAGPIATIFVQKEGEPVMSPSVMIIGFLHMLLSTALMALFLHHFGKGLQGIVARTGLVCAAGVIVTVFSQFSTPIWFLQPFAFYVTNAIYMIVAWAIAGVILGATIKAPTPEAA